MDNEFLSLLNPKRLILTANRRLVAYLTYQYDLKQSQQQKVWDPLRIMPFTQWLQHLWIFHSSGPERVLSDFQEQYIWSQIILESKKSTYPLLNVHSTVSMAQEAWRLMHDWQISWEQLDQHLNIAEVELFKLWAEQFHQYCQIHSWISYAELPKRLQLLLEKKIIPCQETFLIAGFHEIPPAWSQLLLLIRQNTEVLEWPSCLTKTQQSNPIIHQGLIFADPESEFKQMALWAKAEMDNDPDKRIACIVPQLSQYRHKIIDIFKKNISPHSFNVSAGQRLNEFAMIRIALESLEVVAHRKIQFEKLGYLLQSAFLCQNEYDFYIGAHIEASCRKLQQFEFTLTDLYPLFNQWQADYPHHTWLNRWRNFSLIAQKTRGLQQSFKQWTQQFAQLLNALDWPGQRSLNSLEYQLLERWQALLMELSELDAISTPVDFTTAYQYLKNFTAHIIFQPKTGQTQLEILGILESNSLRFDAVWVSGLNDFQWPTPAKPNPFIPYALQVQKQMPHSSQQREYLFAKTITDQLLSSSHEIYLSCSAEEPGRTARFSRLIPISLHPTTPSLIVSHTQPNLAGPLEYLYDDIGPKISTKEPIRGGSSIFIRQAECPFKAFASLRLQAEELEEPQLGISLRQQGILVHRVLEEVWRILKDHASLLEYSELGLNILLEEIIKKVMTEEFPRQEFMFTQIEIKRLSKLVGEWLKVEKLRPPFEIFALESEIHLKISNIFLNLKIDRIDKLDNGTLLLIDYKTRSVQINKWLHPRLEQAQIPLYAMEPTLQNNLGGVSFAQIQAEEMKFKGLRCESLDESNFPSGLLMLNQLKDSTGPQTWQDLLTYWRRALEKLGADFYNGVARVDPVEAHKTCQRCNLQALCRIYAPLAEEEP